ncbi:MAG TPA: hypothetical protein VFB45_15525 [Pseudolabrys sp.]|nr:hypothetical protein [Pseudolabrys sp.]
MNTRTEAEMIYFEAHNMRKEDAISLIEARLKHLFVNGQKSGIEEAAQSIRAVGERQVA